jgi:hydrogenase maturation protein HypF
MGNESIVGAVIRYSGIVQGVGFRPFVYKCVRDINLKGSVQNTDNGVLIRIDGTRKEIEGFFSTVKENPPVLAEIHKSSISFCNPFGYSDFTIIESEEINGGFTPVSPDISVCHDCLAEVFDKEDRRFLYPFTNCTNCGPRFTIIRSIPYDRKNTSMSSFSMCPECLSEYKDPADRRYHAQPNACPVCGPGLRLISAAGEEIAGDPIKKVSELLSRGDIVAVKGLGGYHLAVNPLIDKAVKRLRKRKSRPGKPFALMARDIGKAKEFCIIDRNAENLLNSFESPIVLLKKSAAAASLSNEVAPDTDWLGIMLPYTPLHHILLREGPQILVMTSANISEEPLVFRDDDAIRRLSTIADAFLIHNREIERPCDDSVIALVQGDTVPVRRSRGYVPRALTVGHFHSQVLAAGPSEKNTFCVFKDGNAYMSHHIGNLVNEKSVDAYTGGIEDFLKMFRVKLDAIACDLHPDYVSTRYAEDISRKSNLPLYYVQHHHAHIASVLAENRVTEKVIGVALDGTGYGPDGTVWGGEFLIADRKSYTRAGYYKPVPMPGGEKSVLETDRMGLSYLISAYGSLTCIPDFDFIGTFEKTRFEMIGKMIDSGINCPLTSSCGRLFDAVSALIGLCSSPSYDAQGAILLEKEAGDFKDLMTPYLYEIDEKGAVHFEPAIVEIVKDIKNGESAKTISRKFHSMIVLSGIDMCEKIKKMTGIKRAALSGGVFQNRLILGHFKDQLEERGFSVFINRCVPPNDGGISLGQGVVALNNIDRLENI